MLVLLPRPQAAAGEPDEPGPGAAHRGRIERCRPPPPAPDGHLQRGQSASDAILLSRAGIVLFPFPLVADGRRLLLRALQGLGAAERLRAGFRTFKKTIYE